MATPYYFLHIPKTAGTSLNSWLVESKRFNICPDGLWSQLLARPRSQLDDYSFFFGHFYRHLPAYLGKSVQTITFLRNPIDRTLSHYQHIKRDKNHYFHEKVIKQGSLLAFLRDAETRMMVENLQVRSLSKILDPASFYSVTKEISNTVFPLERHIETVHSGLNDAAALMLSKDFLTRCLFVGITEQMQESIRRLGKVLGIPPGNEIGRLNASPASTLAHLSGSELSELADILALDWELYEFALNKFYVFDSDRRNVY